MKMLIIAMTALLSVGCASKGSVEVLSSRVDAIEGTQATHTSEIDQLKSNQEALKDELSSLSSKLDAAFVKKNLK